MKEKLIENFLRISKIPRGSGNEKVIADFFIQIANENHLYCYRDAYNNVLIKKKGNIKGKTVALQAHLDMVCIKNKDSLHDFTKEGIAVVIDEDKVFAKGTTLGADQGVGLAMMLTIIEDKSLKHPDLEFMFTTEEETTFNGVIYFPYNQIESKMLINLDNCKDDVVIVGADGDICHKYVFYGKLEENHLPSYRIVIDDCFGGNSGIEIDFSKHNAIQRMASILNKKDIYLTSITGGLNENDVATSCEVILHTRMNVEKMFVGIPVQIENMDNMISFSKEDTEEIIKEILVLPSGFISENHATANLGKITTTENQVEIYSIVRSREEDELESICLQRKSLSRRFAVQEIYRDSIWKVDKQSRLLRKYKEVYYKEYLEYPKEDILHGTIECAAIKSRNKDMDIISIGSNIEKFHTVEEVTYVSSWVKIYRLLIALLQEI